MQIDTDTFVNWEKMVQVCAHLLCMHVHPHCNVAESKREVHQNHNNAHIILDHFHHILSHECNPNLCNSPQMRTLKVFPPPNNFPSFIGALHGLCDVALTEWIDHALHNGRENVAQSDRVQFISVDDLYNYWSYWM